MNEHIPINERLIDLEHEYGGVRPACRALEIDPGYWCKLKNGQKANPSKKTLSKLGLQQKIIYINKKPLDQSGKGA